MLGSHFVVAHDDRLLECCLRWRGHKALTFKEQMLHTLEGANSFGPSIRGWPLALAKFPKIWAWALCIHHIDASTCITIAKQSYNDWNLMIGTMPSPSQNIVIPAKWLAQCSNPCLVGAQCYIMWAIETMEPSTYEWQNEKRTWCFTLMCIVCSPIPTHRCVGMGGHKGGLMSKFQ